MSAALNYSDTVPEEAGRILIVDDEPLLRRAMARVLTSLGYCVAFAPDGAVAIERLKTDRFDGVFVDLNMPNAGGIEVLKSVRETDPDLPVVLMSAAPTTASALAAVEHGALRYLTKPFDPAEMGATAERCVKMRRRAAQSRVLLSGSSVDADAHSRFDRCLRELWMARQPIVHAQNGENFAFEWLVRTNEASVKHPGALLGLAEQTERLPELGRAIRALVASREAVPNTLSFVNLHPRDLLDEALYDPGSPLSAIAKSVVLEVTERAALDDVQGLKARLTRLRELGFRVALDDLGEGYAGLSSLVRLAPEFVKIDMSLVRDVHKDDTRRRVIGSIVTLCRELGCAVIAEGVETIDERDALTHLGCELLQGFLFGRPTRA
jgi:EAL domain-containing protein (putative c-di-GMP-specific phosphodiesterase class I)